MSSLNTGQNLKGFKCGLMSFSLQIKIIITLVSEWIKMGGWGCQGPGKGNGSWARRSGNGAGRYRKVKYFHGSLSSSFIENQHHET